jgi:hypothetical protein
MKVKKKRTSLNESQVTLTMKRLRGHNLLKFAQHKHTKVILVVVVVGVVVVVVVVVVGGGGIDKVFLVFSIAGAKQTVFLWRSVGNKERNCYYQCCS